MNIKWIFFDVGTTLVDETEAYNHRIREMIEGTNITFVDFDEKRIELAKQGLDGNSAAIKYFNLKKTTWHNEDERLYRNTKDVLEYLIRKGYKLGIIANQSKGLSEKLEIFGILKYFKLVIASEEVGYFKPNKLIYELALGKADCNSCECAMIGDRLDNDITPAKLIGMKTIWIKQGLAMYQNDELGKYKADWIINELETIKDIF